MSSNKGNNLCFYGKQLLYVCVVYLNISKKKKGISNNQQRVDLDDIPLSQRLTNPRFAKRRSVRSDDSSSDSDSESDSSSNEDDVPLAKRILPIKKTIKRETIKQETIKQEPSRREISKQANVKDESDSEDDVPLVSYK